MNKSHEIYNIDLLIEGIKQQQTMFYVKSTTYDNKFISDKYEAIHKLLDMQIIELTDLRNQLVQEI